MAKLEMLAGSTSQTVNVFIQDSSVTTGAGKTGLAYNTASLTAYYCLPKAAPVAITLATQTATGAWSSGGFVEIDATNTPGLYRLDLPNAALASGRFVNVMLKGAANMAPCVLEIELVAWNSQDTVRGGLTALPNVASGSAGAIITSGTGTAQLSVSSGIASANVSQINSSSTAAQKLERGVRGTTLITVGSGSTATAVVASSISPSGAANDQFLGLVMAFDDNTTTVQLRGQKTVVTDYDNATSTFTVTSLTVAPSSGDTATLS